MIIAPICIIAFFIMGWIVLNLLSPDSADWAITVIGGLIGVIIVLAVGIYSRLGYVIKRLDEFDEAKKDERDEKTKQ
ncbi:MAG: hypothetical protein NC122_08675 [Faecalibacterium sp.]|nr:hypothetical protein [Ruminococcus sp.]MCM1392384.1 hypothetical protein [Ruminococcus sp.]MCM1486268.1 hypothetical protein [Faecalibacterium sp.]